MVCRVSELRSQVKSTVMQRPATSGMLGATCYAFRYTELLERYCGGSLALGCDWEQLREHYEKVGRAESRTYGCAGVTASDLNATGAAAIGSMLAAPHAVSQEQVRLLPRRCQQYHGTLGAHAGSKKNEPHPFMHELHPPPPLASRRCMAWPIELQEGGHAPWSSCSLPMSNHVMPMPASKPQHALAVCGVGTALSR